MLFLSCFIMFHACLFVDTLRSPAWKGLNSWLSFVMSNCDVVTFPLVSWVRCGARLYRLLIFALFLTSHVWKKHNYLNAMDKPFGRDVYLRHYFAFNCNLTLILFLFISFSQTDLRQTFHTKQHKSVANNKNYFWFDLH